MSSTLAIACLGAGYFSRYHFEAWNRLSNCELIAIADVDENKAAKHGPPRVFRSLETMLGNITPDLLDIITPPSTHLAAIELAAAHQIKTVICQKPFCLSLEEAKDAVKIADRAGMRLVIHENFRFQPWYRCMKKHLDSGRLGTPLQMHFKLRTGDGQGVNAYMDRQPYFQTMPRLLMHETGVHWVDTFQFLFGRPTAVYADTRRCNPVISGDDAAYFILDFDNGVRALFDGNRLLDSGAQDSRLTFGESTLEGTKGTLILSNDGQVTFRAFGATTHETALEVQDWPGFAGDCVYALQSHVASAILHNTPLENRATEYLAVIDCVDKLYASAVSGKKMSLLPD